MITGESPALFGEDSGLFEDEENEKTGESTGGPGPRRVKLCMAYARIYSILLKIM